MLQRRGEAAHDRQAEPEAAVLGADRPAALKFLADRLAAIRRDARAGVADLDAQQIAALAAPDQHAAAARVAQRIVDEVLQDAAQQQRIGAHIVRSSARILSFSPRAAASGSNSIAQRLDHALDLERRRCPAA